MYWIRRNEHAADGGMTNEPEEETCGSTGLTFQNCYYKYELLTFTHMHICSIQLCHGLNRYNAHITN